MTNNPLHQPYTAPTLAKPAPESPPSLPSTEELLQTPIQPNDIFQFIPRPCLHAAILRLIRVMRAAAAANTLNTTHQRNSSSPARRTARAMRFASQAQYTRAMRALTKAPIADLNDQHTHTQLRALHPRPPQPIEPIRDRDLPPTPELDEDAVLRAVKRMNPNAAAGPDRMPPRLLHLLVTSEVSPEAGLTGLSVLTRLVCRIVRVQIPDQSLPLLAAATLLLIRPRPDKIRPIAIGQVLRRLVTKVLLPAAISDSKEYLAPQQLANGILSAMDAVVHDARMLMKRHGQDSDFVMVPIDGRNAFNSCSRQQMLDALPTRCEAVAW